MGTIFTSMKKIKYILWTARNLLLLILGGVITLALQFIVILYRAAAYLYIMSYLGCAEIKRNISKRLMKTSLTSKRVALVIGAILMTLYSPVYVLGVITHIVARILLAVAYVAILRYDIARDIIKHLFTPYAGR